MWQDKAIAICQVFLILSLIPTITGKDKPAFLTAASSLVLVGVITFSLGSLGLWFSAATAGLIAVCWLIITLQILRAKKLKPSKL